MSKNWFHKLLAANFVFQSQLYPHVNIACWVRHRRYLRLRCLQGHHVSNNRLGSKAVACPLPAAVREARESRAQLRQKAQSAEPYLAFYCGYRELCTNLGVGSPAAFTTMSFHSFAGPTHLYTLKTLGVPHWELRPRLTAAKGGVSPRA